MAVIRARLRSLYDHPALGPLRLGKRRAGREFLRRATIIVLAVFSLLGVLGLFGRWSPLLDLLNVANPVYWWSSFALLAIAIRHARRNHRRFAFPALVMLSLVCFTGQSVALTRPYLREQPAGISQSGTLRLMSLNAEALRLPPADVANILESADADVLLLQEVGGPSAEASTLLQRSYPFRADCFDRNPWCSFIILSRLPIVAHASHQASWRDRHDTLSWLWADVATPGGPIRLIELHLVYPGPDGRQRAQIDQLKRLLAVSGTHRTVVAGDFNLSQWSAALGEADQAIGMKRSTGIIPTWPDMLFGSGVKSPFAVLAPDQIYTSRGIEVTVVRRGPRVRGHNYSVLAELRAVPIGNAPSAF